MSIQFLSGGRPVVRKFRFSPEDDPARLVISNPVSSVTGTNCNELCRPRRPASETGSTNDGLLVSSKNKHNPVMIYNDFND